MEFGASVVLIVLQLAAFLSLRFKRWAREKS